ncbi:MAG: GntR family transcriptional regulator [Paracoccaceae bacterium]
MAVHRMTAEGSAAPAEEMPAHERAYQALRSEILSGRMAPGQALTLRGVGEALGLSMTPAREAVRRLVAERALTLSETGRVQVADPGRAGLEELFAARGLLEPALAERAARHLAKEDRAPLLDRLRAIDDALEREMRRGDAAAYVAANLRFHATLYAPARAPALMALVESVWLQTAPAMRRINARLGERLGTDFHEAALDALGSGDAAGLAEAIRADVAQGARLLETED